MQKQVLILSDLALMMTKQPITLQCQKHRQYWNNLLSDSNYLTNEATG